MAINPRVRRFALPAPADSAAEVTDRSIGAILVDAGKLSLENVERVIAQQKRESTRFGDAAIQLGFVTADDIQHALSRQFDYAYLAPGDPAVSPELVAGFSPFSPQVEELRALRSQLMLRWFASSPERKALAIASPGRGEGRSFLAANLAVVFSQLGERTLLIDADMRHSRQHELFRIPNRTGLSSMLAGRSERDEAQRIPSFLDLSVLPSGATPPNPVELLGRQIFAQLMERYASEYDVILLDTPPGIEYADIQMIAARARAAAVVVHQHHTRARAAAEFVAMLSSASVTMVGTVLTSF